MDDGEATAISLTRRVLEGFNSGDVASIAALFHPKVSAEFPFAPPGMPASQSGHEAVVATFREGRASIAEITIAPKAMHWCPKDCLLVVEADGTGRLMNGAAYNNSYVFLVGIRDGLVVLWREYFNSLVIARALAGGGG